jgi:3-deoxy-manno-octulosonate cytidylyltransferase (CMP-KDO synthetase)
MAKVAIIIPARYASSRFPGKPLVKIAGMTMIERTYRQSKASKLATQVLVATDDERIKEEVTRFGGELIMTRDDHATGTDRLAEVAQLRPDIDIIVNVQGDEPLIKSEAIDKVIAPLLEDATVEMSTMAFPIETDEEIDSPQIPKVVVDKDGFALYFSRLPIPYHRDKVEGADHKEVTYLGHAGLYVYRRETLLRIAALPMGILENLEKLEQLRALENGIRIKVVTMPKGSRTPAVDVPADVKTVESFLATCAS